MTESSISKHIQLAAPSVGCRLLRNTVGKLRDRHGRMVSFGLAVGSADLIGWCQTGALAVFLAVEVKKPGGRTTPAQRQFLDTVTRMGGLGILAYSVRDFLDEIRRWKDIHG